IETVLQCLVLRQPGRCGRAPLWPARRTDSDTNLVIWRQLLGKYQQFWCFWHGGRGSQESAGESSEGGRRAQLGRSWRLVLGTGRMGLMPLSMNRGTGLKLFATRGGALTSAGSWVDCPKFEDPVAKSPTVVDDPEVHLRNTFGSMDPAGEGRLDWQKIQEGLRQYRVELTAEEGRRVLDRLDADASGRVEYIRLLTIFTEGTSGSRPRTSSPPPGQATIWHCETGSVYHRCGTTFWSKSEVFSAVIRPTPGSTGYCSDLDRFQSALNGGSGRSPSRKRAISAGVLQELATSNDTMAAAKQAARITRLTGQKQRYMEMSRATENERASAAATGSQTLFGVDVAA
ncbi:hypothetical protein KFL_008490010, partial [Klebsormidium nitens]